MGKNKPKGLRFTRSKRRRVDADFKGGEVSSDGGLLLLREGDRGLGLTQQASSVLCDQRQSGKVAHDAGSLLRPRVFALCAGWEVLPGPDAHLVRSPRGEVYRGHRSQ